MNNKTLERLNNLKKQIEKIQDYRDNLQKLSNICNANNFKYTFEFGTVEDSKNPSLTKYDIKELSRMGIGLDFNLEVEVFITLVLKKLDDKLSELREEFENT